MGKNWKHRKKFIRDWCVIWIAVISFVVFANVMVLVQIHTAKVEKELMQKFETYCENEIERSFEDVGILG